MTFYPEAQPDYYEKSYNRDAYLSVLRKVDEQSVDESLCIDSTTGFSLIGRIKYALRKILGWIGFGNYADPIRVNGELLKLLYYGEIHGFMSDAQIKIVIGSISRKMQDEIGTRKRVQDAVSDSFAELTAMGNRSPEEVLKLRQHMRERITAYYQQHPNQLNLPFWNRVWNRIFCGTITLPPHPSFGETYLVLAQNTTDTTQSLKYYKSAVLVGDPELGFQQRFASSFFEFERVLLFTRDDESNRLREEIYSLMGTHAFNAKRFADAARHFESARAFSISQSGKEVELRQKIADSYTELGRQQCIAGQTDNAIRALESAIKYTPITDLRTSYAWVTLEELYSASAQWYLKQKDTHTAINFLDKALQYPTAKHENSNRSTLALCLLQTHQSSRLKDCIDHLNFSLPEHQGVLTKIVQTWLSAVHQAKVVDLYEKAAQQKRDLSWCHGFYSQACIELGNGQMFNLLFGSYQTAIEYYTKALSMPGNEHLKEPWLQQFVHAYEKTNQFNEAAYLILDVAVRVPHLKLKIMPQTEACLARAHNAFGKKIFKVCGNAESFHKLPYANSLHYLMEACRLETEQKDKSDESLRTELLPLYVGRIQFLKSNASGRDGLKEIAVQVNRLADAWFMKGSYAAIIAFYEGAKAVTTNCEAQYIQACLQLGKEATQQRTGIMTLRTVTKKQFAGDEISYYEKALAIPGTAHLAKEWLQSLLQAYETRGQNKEAAALVVELRLRAPTITLQLSDETTALIPSAYYEKGMKILAQNDKWDAFHLLDYDVSLFYFAEACRMDPAKSAYQDMFADLYLKRVEALTKVGRQDAVKITEARVLALLTQWETAKLSDNIIRFYEKISKVAEFCIVMYVRVCLQIGQEASTKRASSYLQSSIERHAQAEITYYKKVWMAVRDIGPQSATGPWLSKVREGSIWLQNLIQAYEVFNKHHEVCLLYSEIIKYSPRTIVKISTATQQYREKDYRNEYLPELFFTQGEEAFDKKKWADAIRSYLEAITHCKKVPFEAPVSKVLVTHFIEAIDHLVKASSDNVTLRNALKSVEQAIALKMEISQFHFKKAELLQMLKEDERQVLREYMIAMKHSPKSFTYGVVEDVEKPISDDGVNAANLTESIKAYRNLVIEYGGALETA